MGNQHECVLRGSLAALRQTIASQHTLVLVTHKPVLLGLVNRLIVLAPNGIMLDGPRDAVLEKLRQGAQQVAQAHGMRVVKPAPAGPVEERAV